MIISLIEMLKLPNFGDLNTSTIDIESLDKILLGCQRSYNMITFISK